MLLHDVQHDFAGYHGSPSGCRVRLFLPAEDSGHDTYIVILTDDQNAHGTSITNAGDVIAGQVCRRFNLPPERAVFIEHYDFRHLPPSHDNLRQTEDFFVVAFSRATAAALAGDLSPSLGRPSWRPTDKQSVEILIGEPLS